MYSLRLSCLYLNRSCHAIPPTDSRGEVGTSPYDAEAVRRLFEYRAIIQHSPCGLTSFPRKSRTDLSWFPCRGCDFLPPIVCLLSNQLTSSTKYPYKQYTLRLVYGLTDVWKLVWISSKAKSWRIRSPWFCKKSRTCLHTEANVAGERKGVNQV